MQKKDPTALPQEGRQCNLTDYLRPQPHNPMAVAVSMVPKQNTPNTAPPMGALNTCVALPVPHCQVAYSRLRTAFIFSVLSSFVEHTLREAVHLLQVVWFVSLFLLFLAGCFLFWEGCLHLGGVLKETTVCPNQLAYTLIDFPVPSTPHPTH